jgi:hypothetical protein
LNLNNPYMRFLFVIVATAAAIRLLFELLAPVALYLLGGLIVCALVRLVGRYRRRW